MASLLLLTLLLTAVGVSIALAQPPGNTLSIDLTKSVGEAQGSVTVNVKLNAASSETITVQFDTAPGSAEAGTDFESQTGTLTFAPGETEKTTTIYIIDDAIEEGEEYFYVQISLPSANATIGDNWKCTVTIIDNDGPPPATVVSFEYSSFTVGEADGTATITVLMTGAPTDSVSITCSTTSGGTAIENVDYTPRSAVLTWLPSEAGTTKTFTISIVDNALIDGMRTVNLALSNAANATLNILDDDELCPAIAIDGESK